HPDATRRYDARHPAHAFRREPGAHRDTFENAAEHDTLRGVAADADEARPRMGTGIRLIAAPKLRQEAHAIAAGRDFSRRCDEGVVSRIARLFAVPFDRAARGREPATEINAWGADLEHALLIAALAKAIIEHRLVID